MPRHTPGPWSVGRHGVISKEPIVDGVDGTADVEYYGGYLICETVAPSNAPLIAAAPALLEGLRQCADRLERCIVISDSASPDYAAAAVKSYRDLIATVES